MAFGLWKAELHGNTCRNVKIRSKHAQQKALFVSHDLGLSFFVQPTKNGIILITLLVVQSLLRRSTRPGRGAYSHSQAFEVGSDQSAFLSENFQSDWLGQILMDSRPWDIRSWLTNTSESDNPNSFNLMNTLQESMYQNCHRNFARKYNCKSNVNCWRITFKYVRHNNLC